MSVDRLPRLGLLVALCAGAVACSAAAPNRPLNCPVVTCKAVNCKTPPKGAPYMSDDWRCVTVSP